MLRRARPDLEQAIASSQPGKIANLLCRTEDGTCGQLEILMVKRYVEAEKDMNTLGLLKSQVDHIVRSLTHRAVELERLMAPTSFRSLKIRNNIRLLTSLTRHIQRQLDRMRKDAKAA